MKKYNFQKGQSLLELLIALSVVLLVVLALVSAVTVTVNSTDFAKKRAQAASLSQQGLEYMRIQKDTNWVTFSSWANGTDYGLSGTTPSGSCAAVTPINSVFSRCVKLDMISDPDPKKNKIQATVTVSWTDSKGTHKSELVSYYTNW